jgi:hypothetical protein
MDMVWLWAAVARRRAAAAMDKLAMLGGILSSWRFRIEDSFLFGIRKANETRWRFAVRRHFA